MEKGFCSEVRGHENVSDVSLRAVWKKLSIYSQTASSQTVEL